MVVWLAGCWGGDPELTSRRRALDAWEAGARSLEAGDPLSASEAFEAARSARPNDALLVAWHAEARAAAGDVSGAVELLAGALEAEPGFAEARYNRAAYLARSGRLEEAGPELERALQQGVRCEREAMVDPDFAPHLAHPAFGFLPDELLMIAVDAPREAVFWGSEATVRLRVMGALGIPVGVEAEGVSGPVELIGAMEDVVHGSEGPQRDLSWTFGVRGAGEVVIGPLTVRSGPHTTRLAAIRFPTTAPPGKEVPPPLGPAALDVPTALAAGLEVPSARVVGDRLEVLAPPNTRVRVDPPPSGPAVRYELRERSRPVWVLHRFPVDPQRSYRIDVGDTRLP